jgi:hypothetical protein
LALEQPKKEEEMYRFLFLCGFGIAAFAPPVNATFVGELKFTPAGCEAKRDCKLVYDFGYIDPKGIGWVTIAGDRTDGASIPKWAQWLIGRPFKKSFIKAAVIHDQYCDRHVRPESQTHRAFYDALRESRVPQWKAHLMHYAVIVGSTHWSQLIPGKKCSVGKICVRNVGVGINLHGGKIVTSATGDKVLVKKESFNSPGFKTDLREVAAILKKKGNALSVNDIEALARTRHPNDFFINAGDAILYEDSQSRYPKE